MTFSLNNQADRSISQIKNGWSVPILSGINITLGSGSYSRGKAKYLIGVILDPVLSVFHDFGLTFFLHINVFFVLLKVSKNAFYVVAR